MDRTPTFPRDTLGFENFGGSSFVIDSATPRPYEQWRKVPPRQGRGCRLHVRVQPYAALSQRGAESIRLRYVAENSQELDKRVAKRLIPRFLEGYCQGEGAFCR